MQLIPRRFHRIWLGDCAMPHEFAEFGRTWLAKHPGWTMHTWTDESIAGLTNMRAFQSSSALSGKSNVIRYEILLRYGGVYIDTDFECLRNIEPLLDGVTCFVGEQSPGFANNAIMGAIRGHAFIRDLVGNLTQRVADFSGQPSIKQSGPYFLNEVLEKRRDVMRFPAAFFYPYQWHERWRRHEKFPTAYGAHHWHLSWRNKDRSEPCAGAPKISVLLVNHVADIERLTWVLEGLCEQTPTGTFDLSVLDNTKNSLVKGRVDSFASRLKATYIQTTSNQRGLLSEEIKDHAIRSRAPRILFLDGRCVPDRKTVQEHAMLGDNVIGFSLQRLYPGHKFYRFVPPLDYDSMQMHSVSNRRTRDTSTLPNVAESCISIPTEVLTKVELPPTVAVREGGRWLAWKLVQRGYILHLVPKGAGVIRLLN